MSGHLGVEDLSALLDERLDSARAAEAERHLATCDECAERMAGLRRSVESLRSLARAAPPPELLHRVRRQAAALPARSGLLDRLGGWWQPMALRPAFAAAFSLVFALALGVFALNAYYARRAAPKPASGDQPLEAYLRSGVPPGPSGAATPAKPGAAAPPPSAAPSPADLLSKSEPVQLQEAVGNRARDARQSAAAQGRLAERTEPSRRLDRVNVGGNEEGRQAEFADPRMAGRDGKLSDASQAKKVDAEVASVTAESPATDDKDRAKQSAVAGVGGMQPAANSAAAAEPAAAPAPAPAPALAFAPAPEAPVAETDRALGSKNGTLAETLAAAKSAKESSAPAGAAVGGAAAAKAKRLVGERTFERTGEGWREHGVEGRPRVTLSADSAEGRAALARNPGVEDLLKDGPVVLRDGRRVIELRPAVQR